LKIIEWLVVTLLSALFGVPMAHAQDYPSKPVTLIVPQAPGGANDITARAIAKALGESMKQTFIVDNRPGAGGNIGAQQAARAPNTGYTLMLTLGSTLVINPHLYKRPGFDAKDFEPIGPIVRTPYVLVTNSSFPAKNVAELVAAAKARPGEIFYGSAGNGTPNHLLGEMFKTLTKTKIVHVPYKGAAASLNDTVAGQTQMNFSSLPLALPLIRDGRLHALGITSISRSALAPDIPTFAESLPGFTPDMWIGLLAPAGTPKAIVQKLHAELQAALKSKELRGTLEAQGLEVVLTQSPSEFAAMIAKESANWKKIVTEAGASVDE
jgi:tripartite-type tricarboxylate transporter receptor subunit TctC